MNNYKEHIFPTESLIGGWYMPESICDNMIDIFKTSKKEENKIYLNKEDVTDPVLKISLETGVRNKEYEDHLNNILELYKQKYSFCNVGTYGINDLIKIQYYEPNEGFFKWHIENTYKPHNKKRHLVFMTYLNDVENGGTEFLYQNLTSPAKKGLTLFWPAYYTHPHRGQISSTKEKYIATAWYTFNE